MAVLSILLVFCVVLLFGVARHSRCALITWVLTADKYITTVWNSQNLYSFLPQLVIPIKYFIIQLLRENSYTLARVIHIIKQPQAFDLFSFTFNLTEEHEEHHFKCRFVIMLVPPHRVSGVVNIWTESWYIPELP